ncbi:MAG: cytochrome c oxidase subunit 3 [Microthrixaceae bacterium]
MSQSTSEAAVAAYASAAPIPRRREMLFGSAFATAGVSMLVVVLVANYLIERTAGGAQWLVDNQIPLTQPNMQLITLGMSVVTMQWAFWSIARDDRYHTYMAIGTTLLLGAAFVNQTTFLYKMAGITIAQPEGPLFYAVTGTHLAMMIAAMIFLVLVLFRVLAGQYSSRLPDGIGAVAILWYAGVALYALIWFAVYVQK